MKFDKLKVEPPITLRLNCRDGELVLTIRRAMVMEDVLCLRRVLTGAKSADAIPLLVSLFVDLRDVDVDHGKVRLPRLAA